MFGSVGQTVAKYCLPYLHCTDSCTGFLKLVGHDDIRPLRQNSSRAIVYYSPLLQDTHRLHTSSECAGTTSVSTSSQSLVPSWITV